MSTWLQHQESLHRRKAETSRTPSRWFDAAGVGVGVGGHHWWGEHGD